MPEITLLGWFHTVIGILLATLITALSALGIFQHGSFGVAHGLAILTLLGLAIGTLAAATGIFGKLSRYVQATGYSATLLFHMIPAITDFMLRLPVGDPFLTSIEDPILKMSYLVLLVLFLAGLSFQFVWIRRQ